MPSASSAVRLRSKNTLLVTPEARVKVPRSTDLSWISARRRSRMASLSDCERSCAAVLTSAVLPCARIGRMVCGHAPGGQGWSAIERAPPLLIGCAREHDIEAGMGEVWRHAITDRSAWQGADLAADRSWEFTLLEAHRAELAAALRLVKDRGLALGDIDRAAFPLPTLAPLLAKVLAELRQGRGFALLHGFPVADHPWADLEVLYWGLSAHIGTGLTQNSDAGLIHYVTEGALRPNQGRRAVGFPRASYLHVDLTDVTSLLCVRQAPDDPPSRMASSITVHNGILSQDPAALERLYAGFEWDRMDEHGADETPTSGYPVPVFSQTNGMVSCRYNRNWINTAALRRGQPLSPAEHAIFDLFDTIANETRFEFPFHPGDIQFCNNYTVLHGRAPHEPVTAEDQRRVLMRIWMDVPGFRLFADEALVRYGVGRHGQIGWTAAEVRAGRNTRPRVRRADGALALS
ncbi:MAG: hypothetical protein EXQ96_10265 [Alphaproteobacteria bacterium]|nr:hypothetical protein [Alphaproteobacteria bacterium]